MSGERKVRGVPGATGTPASRARRAWDRRLRATFTERLELKVTALVLAIVLWFMVSARETTEEIVSVRFAPQLDSSLALREPPRPVSALVIGRRGELMKLVANAPVIRRPIDDEVPDTLSLDLRPSDVELPPNVDARVSDVQPRRITLLFQSDLTRLVPVRPPADLSPDAARRVATIRFEPESVRVAGPRRAVARIGAIHPLRSALPGRDSGTYLVTLDTAELGVRVRPARVMAIVSPAGNGVATSGGARADSSRLGADSGRP
ncbi:MAG: hypothetical protein ABR499_16305 [Gemmatimonadaceae bacterium]